MNYLSKSELSTLQEIVRKQLKEIEGNISTNKKALKIPNANVIKKDLVKSIQNLEGENTTLRTILRKLNTNN